MIAKNIIQTRLGGKVKRCHNIPHNREYNVASHSWGVAMLMLYIWPESFPKLSAYCLTHDIHEAWVGDIPSPTLKYNKPLKNYIKQIQRNIDRSLGLPIDQNLSEEDLLKILFCDWLDFWLWCKEEELMGNQYVREGRLEIERYFYEVQFPEEAKKLFKELNEVNLLPVQQEIMKGFANDS